MASNIPFGECATQPTYTRYRGDNLSAYLIHTNTWGGQPTDKPYVHEKSGSNLPICEKWNASLACTPPEPST